MRLLFGDWNQHFFHSYDPASILREFFHFSQFVPEAVWIVIEFGGDLPTDVTQPVKSVVLGGGWWL